MQNILKMNESTPITTLFLDIGGVMLTNGCGQKSRRKAADVFKIAFDGMEERHHLIFYAGIMRPNCIGITIARDIGLMTRL